MSVNRFCPPWLYSGFIFCALFVIRIPTLLPNQMNPDESMLLAGAMKLRHFPVFWQSLDGTTSGPLNYYPLTILNLIGLRFDYASARLLNIVCIGGAIAIVYAIARLYLPDGIARLTPLPPLAAAMAFRNQDFIHYSSECVSVLLIAVGTWLLLDEVASGRAVWARGAGIGVIVVLLPFAKLQAAPMAAVIALGVIALIALDRPELRSRRAGAIAIGFCAAAALLTLFLFAFHLWGTFDESYIRSNLRYADASAPLSLRDFVGFCLSPDVEWYELGAVAFLLCLGVFLCYAWRRPNRPVARFSFPDLFACGLLLANLYAVHRPGRKFPHYLLFLIFPVALIAVRTLARLVEISRQNISYGFAAIVFLLFTLIAPFFIRTVQLRLNPQSELWMTFRRPRPLCIPCDLVNQFATPGDPITVWGWAPEVYVLTQTIPATRDVLTYWQIEPGPLENYYRSRYLGDLESNPPKVFVDAVAPGEFYYNDRHRYGYEAFPALHQFVASNYYLASEIVGVRVFARITSAR